VITSIHSATIVVSDQDQALDFYVNKLGWQIAMDNEMPGMRWLTVAPPGATTQLVLGHASWAGGPEGAKGGNTGISLSTPDIDATYETLTARGVKFKQPVEVMPWGGKATWFSDPDGNEFFPAEG
jgi:predicted enzyme related to lactoylglutathione lyase